MGETVVRLSGVVAGYGAAPVLSGADLEIRGGEHVALLGPNGSGKTTLLRVVAGTLTPRAGDVELFGRPIRAWNRGDLARAVTVLPQGMELPAGFTVAEVVAFGRIPHARSWFASTADDEAAVARALVEADVDALADRRRWHRSPGCCSWTSRPRTSISAISSRSSACWNGCGAFVA
jgi:iron complex transport system ATP-binding protein